MQILLIDCLIFIFAILELAQLYTVLWNTNSVIVHQGDAVNLTCTVSDIEFMDVIRVSYKNHNGLMVTIADNKDVKLPFSNISRYGVEFYITDDIGYITVSYRDIQGEDAGSLLCQKLPGESSSDEVKLKVQVPVKEIYLRLRTLSGWKIMTATDVIVLREMETNELECVAVVDGGLTPAVLQATVGTEDQTHLFTASEEIKVIKTDDNGLVRYYSVYKLIYSSMIPPHAFNGMWLTCMAAQDDFHNCSTSVLLSIEYGPVLMCSKYEHHSRLGGSVHVVCEAVANPFSHSVKWMMDIMGESATTRRVLISDDHIQLSETFVDNNRKRIQLTIRTVQKSHFTKYYLSVENDISSAEVTIVLLPGSLELNQMPSSQDQMMFFVRQQLPQTEIGVSYMKSVASINLPALNRILLMVIVVAMKQTWHASIMCHCQLEAMFCNVTD